MHNGHFWHLSETSCKPYSLFGKVHNQWKRVSPITCRNKREAKDFFYKTLAKSSAYKVPVMVRPVQ